ncbi:SIMPL domain-containing protein [Kangiella geojedonensis]|uniref:SIMPL domain-containing protein n=1 Tax=Kangiella geojedonensis TaxID=914150 RepID=A0A0F6RAX3_9GAMM|nr:SIMPL domain-containing protein [Kangiella geojedonensis]AKE51053.1 hypothetical protein TQ33_0061 [Kangiella geojedonensis]
MKVVIGILLTLLSVSIDAAPQGRHIFVEGEGVYTATPDSAKIKLKLEFKGNTALGAKQAADSAFKDFVSGIGEFDIAEDDFSSSKVVTRVNTDYDLEGRRVNDGYIATRGITLTLNNLEQLNIFLDYALSKGVKEIRDVDLKSSKEKEYQAKAKEMAIKSAISEAKDTAEMFGMVLGSVYSINSNYSDSYDFYSFDKEAVEKITVTASRMPKEMNQYLKAKINFSASIEAIFDLEKP